MPTTAILHTPAPTRKFGHAGFSASSDPTIPKNDAGHPIKHVFTRSIPSSQCMICHIHPGTNMVTTYFGLTWWDNEIDGDKMYPARAAQPNRGAALSVFRRNPEGAAVRGSGGTKIPRKRRQPEFNKRLKPRNSLISTATGGSSAPF